MGRLHYGSGRRVQILRINEGIEFFTSLESLTYALVDSVDLSQNKALKILVCNSHTNYLKLPEDCKLDSLTCSTVVLESIDINACKQLKNLCLKIKTTGVILNDLPSLEQLSSIAYYSDGASFQNLDLKNNKRLKRIVFTGAIGLMDIDLSGCEALEEFTPTGKNYALNLKGCKSLKSLAADYAYSINLEGCVGLETFESRRIGNIDLSDCIRLKEIFIDSGDGVLDLSKNHALESITVYNMTIKELNGSLYPNLRNLTYRSDAQPSSVDIQNCSALESLYITSSLLTSLQFKGCTSLDNTRLEGNAGEVDVSDCPNLFLDCYGLTCLDFNKSIRGLKLYTTESFPGLDLSGCASLEHLEFYNYNPSAFLRLNGCQSLKYLKIYHLYQDELSFADCGALEEVTMEWVGIKELDLSEKTNLIYLLCSNMDIECLDTSNSPLLETLRCPSNSQLKMLNIKGNPSLQNLDCRSCALQSLDLSGNPALQYIDCSSNYVLRTVDVRPCLSLFRFTGLDSVETVYVTAKQFSSTTFNVHPNTRILIQ